MEDLHIVNIEKVYGTNSHISNEKFTLNSMNLTIKKGEFLSLLGPSGCGKTTVLKIIAGLLVPDKGDLLMGSINITSLNPESRGFGMVFQQALLFPNMTVEENVSFGLKMQGVKKVERLEKARKMLERVGLDGYGTRNPIDLSGGQQQRVSLARALVSKPRLLLMDEPFSALDPGLREEMRDLLSEIHKEFKVTILFVTHDRDEAYQLSDRIGVMNNGVLLQVAAPKELYENPINPIVAKFLGAKNVLRGSLQNGSFITDDLNVKVQMNHLSDGKGWLIIRPESLQPYILKKQEEFASEEEHHLISGTVKQVSFRQGYYSIKVEIGSTLLVSVYPTKDVPPVNRGDKIQLSYRIDQLSLIQNE